MSGTTDSTGVTDASNRPSLLALLGWLAFVVLLVHAIFIGGGYRGILDGPLRMASLCLIATALVVWGLLALRRPAWRPRSAIWPALIVPLGALTVASLASAFPRLGLEYVAWAILLVALYLFLVRILAFDFSRARIGGLAAILGFVVGFAYLGNAVARWLEWWELLGRLTAPMLRPAYAGLSFGGPTAVATVMIILTAVAFTGLGFGSRDRKIVLGALSAMAIAVVLITGGRTAWLASTAGMILVGVVYAVRHRDGIREQTSQRRWRRAGIGLIAVAILAAILFAPGLTARLDVSSDGGRTTYFATAMRMFEASPLVGQGPGTWAARRIAFTEAGERDIYVSHAHNIYSQTLAELGLLGVAAGAIALLALLWLIVGGLRDADPARRRYGYGALFVLLYFVVDGLLDSYVDLPLAYLLAALPFALLDGTSPRIIGDTLLSGGRVLPIARRVAGIAVFVSAFAAGLMLFRVESTAWTHAQAVVAADQGDWEAASPAAAEAVAADPDMIPYHLTRGITAAGTGDWTTAESSFGRAAIADDLPQAWLDLALARLEMDRAQAEVVEAIERALRVGDQHGSILLAAGYLYDRLGMTTEADGLYVHLLSTTPSVAADPAWVDELVGEERLDRLVDAALTTASSPWELALMAGDAERARALLESAGGSALASDFIDAWTGDAEAAARLRDLALASPSDRTLAEWATRVSALQGDADEAARFRRIAQFGSEETGIRGFEVRIRPVHGEADPGMAVVVNNHGLKGYRRATPSEVLAPGLPTLVLADLSAAR